MPTTTLYALGAKGHSQIKKLVDGDTMFIKFDGHYYSAPLKQFVRENFRCPIVLVI